MKEQMRLPECEVAMLDQYLAGAIPQMIERGRVLTASIPRDLPRDYDALRTTCKQQVDESIWLLQHCSHL